MPSGINMKILLLGEFSGLFLNLKQGLEKNGQEVSLYSNGDGWKAIPGSDGVLFPINNPPCLINKVKNIISCCIYPYISKSKFYGYDIVQVINSNVYYGPLSHIILYNIKKHSGKMFISAAGDDYFTYRAWKNGNYRYWMFDDDPTPTDKYEGWFCYPTIFSEKRIVKFVDKIIPNLYEYALAYQNIPNRTKTIPFPINVDEIPYQENIISEKIVFFHGLNREAAKGTKYIREAMRIIQDKYPEEVECVIDGKLPYEEYLKLLSRTNVVIDQCLSYGYGMNACIAMAQGKVVMSGFEPETLEELELETCPGINIIPNVDDIVSKMEWIIQHKEEIPRIGYESRQHIEKYHHYVKIAQKYVEIWMSD